MISSQNEREREIRAEMMAFMVVMCFVFFMAGRGYEQTIHCAPDVYVPIEVTRH